MSSQLRNKILMVMPALPFEGRGAEQMDRDSGIRQLIRLGYEVRVIAKTNAWQDAAYLKRAEKSYGVPVIGIPYKYSNRKISFGEKLKNILLRFKSPLYLDGAALEYAELHIQRAVRKEIDEWKPDLAWFEYTFLWPLYHILRERNIPIITRSANFEPRHFLDEAGRSPLNYVKYLAKLAGEKRTIEWSTVLLSISPTEKELYEHCGARKVLNLPLRGLPLYLNRVHDIRDRTPLNVFFMGSTYTVGHNKEALRTVVAEVAPLAHKLDPGGFVFHIFGKKYPAVFDTYIKDNVKVMGFQEDDSYLDDMDIALIPSRLGAGMQQKIFEPLALGIPEVTSARGLGGYPFENAESVLSAGSAEDFANVLLRLRDKKIREQLSVASNTLSRRLFSQEALDAVVEEAIRYSLS